MDSNQSSNDCRIRTPGTIEKIHLFPSITRQRIRNIFVEYPQRFSHDYYRYKECLQARKLIFRHPWWFFQWKPQILQKESVGKMAFSMMRGPVWRWETADLLHEAKKQKGTKYKPKNQEDAQKYYNEILENFKQKTNT